MSHRPDGTFFRCKLGPLPADILAALESAAQSRRVVRLVFESAHIDFVGVAITRAEPGWIELVGRLATPRE